VNPDYPEKNIKQLIVEIGKKLYEKGYAPGMSGNISFRQENKIFITGTGFCLGDLSETKVSVIDLDGNILDDTSARPSSENKMHLEIYKLRPDVNSIIHAHCPYATAIGVIKDFKYLPILAEAEVLLGKIAKVDYSTPSTYELALAVAEKFSSVNAALMTNHGATVCGKDLYDALYRLETLEFYAQVYLFSGLSANRSVLTDANLKELEKFKH